MTTEAIWIELNPQRIAFCEYHGSQRTERRRSAAHKNNLAKNYELDCLRDQRAMMAEAAAMLWLSKRIPVTWDIGDVPGLADLEDFIDVKRVDQVGHRLIMQLDGRLDWAYVLCCGQDHPRYWLRGWHWGYEIKRLASIRDLQPNRPAHVLETEHLLQMQQLHEEIQRRRSKPK